MLREELEELKVGQEIQDGAIVELAEIIGGGTEEVIEDEVIEDETETEEVTEEE